MHEVGTGVAFSFWSFLFLFLVVSLLLLFQNMRLVLVTLHLGEENLFCMLQILWNLLKLALKLDTWSIKHIYTMCS